jgi:hypothetical protein
VVDVVEVVELVELVELLVVERVVVVELDFSAEVLWVTVTVVSSSPQAAIPRAAPIPRTAAADNARARTWMVRIDRHDTRAARDA